MKTFSEKTQIGLIRKFHALMNRVGMDSEDKEYILSQYGVRSTKELKPNQLI